MRTRVTPTTIERTLIAAAEQIEQLTAEPDIAETISDKPLSEVVTDKGYHSNEKLVDLKELGIRTYISEPKRGRRNWTGKAAERDAVYANRRRIRGERGKKLLRQRGLMLDRPVAHCYETGGMRRLHLRGGIAVDDWSGHAARSSGPRGHLFFARRCLNKCHPQAFFSWPSTFNTFWAVIRRNPDL